MTRYSCPTEITFDQGSELIGYDIKNMLIKLQYGIKAKPYSSRNRHSNIIIEIIHQVLGNLVRAYNLHKNYIYDNYPWMRVLEASSFSVQSTYHRIKDKSQGQIVFGRDMIIPIKYVAH